MTATAVRPTRTACSNVSFSASRPLTSARNGLRSSSVTRPAEGPAGEMRGGCVSASASGSSRRPPGGRVVLEPLPAVQVAEDPAMARRRPGVVQRPFHLDPLHGQPRPL